MNLSVVKKSLQVLIILLLLISCTKDDPVIQESQIVISIPNLKGTDNAVNSKIYVYPNPFKDKITISTSLPEGTFADIQLSNKNGEFILQEIVYSGSFKIDVKDLIVGVYYFEIKVESYVNRFQILKAE